MVGTAPTLPVDEGKVDRIKVQGAQPTAMRRRDTVRGPLRTLELSRPTQTRTDDMDIGRQFTRDAEPGQSTDGPGGETHVQRANGLRR